MLKSANLIIRNTEKNDLDFVLRLESNEENKPFIIPWDKQKHESALTNKDMAHLIMENRATHQPVGYIILAGLQNPNQSIELIRIVVAEKGKGFGKEALRLMKKRVFEEWGAHRLWLDVKVNNIRARHVYESEGFIAEGVLRECLKNGGTFESLCIMSMLRSEYKAALTKL